MLHMYSEKMARHAGKGVRVKEDEGVTQWGVTATGHRLHNMLHSRQDQRLQHLQTYITVF